MKNVFLSLTLLILRMFAVAPQKCILQKAKKYIYLVEGKSFLYLWDDYRSSQLS